MCDDHGASDPGQVVGVVPAGDAGGPGAARRVVAGGGTGRPAKLHADKGYDYEHLRKRLRARNIVPRIVRRGIETSSAPAESPGEVR
ncbi:transposase [Streptomyces sp. FR-008]|nr:transposase [Streptomyces sp. FR-008]